MLEHIGNAMVEIGNDILPFSFVSYFILGILTYLWDIRYYCKLGKAVWYLLNLILVLTSDINIEKVATMILAFEMFDAYLDYKEEKKDKRIKKDSDKR